MYRIIALATIAGLWITGLLDRTLTVKEPDARDPERGSVSVEQVVITAALLIAAIALVAVIGNAIANRSTAIS